MFYKSLSVAVQSSTAALNYVWKWLHMCAESHPGGSHFVGTACSLVEPDFAQIPSREWLLNFGNVSHYSLQTALWVHTWVSSHPPSLHALQLPLCCEWPAEIFWSCVWTACAQVPMVPTPFQFCCEHVCYWSCLGHLRQICETVTINKGKWRKWTLRDSVCPVWDGICLVGVAVVSRSLPSILCVSLSGAVHGAVTY